MIVGVTRKDTIDLTFKFRECDIPDFFSIERGSIFNMISLHGNS